MKIFSPVLKGTTTVSDGTTNLSGSFSGSFTGTATTASLAITSSYVLASSVDAQQTSRLNTLESVTGSFTLTSSFDAYTASNDSQNTTQNARLLSNEQKTGSFATTGSNYFIGTQVVTGSVFISSDLVVQGSSSLQNITASAVSVGTNTIILNTATPILQFGGISVQDSGSTMGRSGSLLWNSINDHWINVNPSGSDEGYNSAMVINGPKNTGSLGNEVGLTTNYIPVSQGEDHITDSVMFQSGSNIGIGTTSPTGSNVSNLLHLNGASAVLRVGPYYSAGGDRDFIELIANGSDTKVTSPNERFIIENTAGSIIISASGSVGVGTTSPARKLVVAADDTNSGDSGQFHIIGATNANLKLMLGYDTTSEYAYIKATKSGTGTRNLILQPDGSNVGIGATSPIYALDVYTNQNTYTARFYQPNSTTSNYNAVLWSGAHSPVVGYVTIGGSAASNASLRDIFSIGTQNAYGFTLVTNDVGRMFINSSGSVGIGTTNPSRLLHISGTGTDGTQVQINGTGDSAGIKLIPVSGDNWEIQANTSNQWFVYNRTDSAYRLLIDGSGNVGIGTTSPNSLVEIIKSSNAGSGAAFPRLSIANTLATQGDGSSTYNFADLRIAAGNAAVEVYLSATYAAGTWAPAGILNVATNHDLQFKTNNAERMRILSTGDIQFPNSFAFKSVASSGYIAMYANGGGLYWGGIAATNQMHLTAAGNLGIGTISPTTYSLAGRHLELNDAGGGYSFIHNNSTSVKSFYAVNNSEGSAGLYTFSDHFLKFGTVNTERMRITSSGSVGIGTTSPSSRLGVAATGADGLVMEPDLGSINNSTRIFFKSSVQTYGLFNNSADLRFTYDAIPGNTSGTSLARFANTGKYFRMESGTGGIQFGGNTGAVSALNYYEEGNWTPQLVWSNGGTYTMSGLNSGRYVRIGSLVHLQFQLQWSSFSGSSGGTLRVTGIPFAAGGTSRSAGSICANASMPLNSGYTWLGLTIDPSVSFIYIIENASAGGYSHVPNVNSSGIVYSLTITYSVA
jgi:hypothetical protein